MRALFTRFAEARPRLLLVVLALALLLPGLFVLPPTDRDEARFAQATKQMIETGDFVRIMNGAVPRNRKPIGIYWLQAPFAAAARATGVAQANPIWPYRLPSLLGALAAVLATYEAGLALLGARAALLGALLLAGTVLLTVEAHIAKTDAALLAATTIAAAGLARAWAGRLSAGGAAAFWVALGAGILLKGPVTPMVVGLTALAAALSARRWGWLRALRPGWGLPLMLAVAAPWFIAIGLATHGAFFRDAVGGDLGRKLTGGEETHGGPPGLHLLLLPLLAFPATIPVLSGLATALAAAWRRRLEWGARFLLCWLVPAWLVFELTPTKLPHYPLPLYPALCLLGGAWLASGAAPAAMARLLLGLATLILGAGALALPLVLHASPLWGLPALAASLAAGAFAWRGRILPALGMAAALHAALLAIELPALHALWIAPRAVALLRHAWPAWRADGLGLVAGGFAEPSLMFLAGTWTELPALGEGAAAALATHRGGAALIERHILPDFEAAAARRGMALRRMGEVEGFNYSRGRTVELTLFVRAE